MRRLSVRQIAWSFLIIVMAVTIVAKTSVGPLATMPYQVTDSVGSLVNVDR